MNALVLDSILLILLAALVVVGYRRGFVIGVLALLGFLLGGGVVLAFLPGPLSSIGWLKENELVRTVLLISTAFACATVLQAVTMALGYRLHARIKWRAVRLVDSILGALAPGALMILVVWFVAGAIAGSSSPDLNRAIGQSSVLSAVDDLVPWEQAQPVGEIRPWLDQAGVTSALGGLTSGAVQAVGPPDPRIATRRAILAESQSVVRITGFAEACLTGQEGSGFVIAPGKVITNAHVVAGMTSPTVYVHGESQAYSARVVIFDPTRDLAVLAVDGLKQAPLRIGEPQQFGSSAVLAGYPLDGPLKFQAVRVRARISTIGTDIYANPGVQRALYSLYAHVEQGNSGGPLLAEDGSVIGVVVSRSLNDPATGYALRLAELRPVAEAAGTAMKPVSTGGCATG